MNDIVNDKKSHDIVNDKQLSSLSICGLKYTLENLNEKKLPFKLQVKFLVN